MTHFFVFLLSVMQDQFPMKKIAFVVAPYGFGPTAKTIAITQQIIRLSKIPKIVFISQGPATEIAEGINLFSEVWNIDFYNSHALCCISDDCDVLVFVNTSRHILRLSSFASKKLYFVDTLAWVRDKPIQCMHLLDAYFAQEFFGYEVSKQIKNRSNYIPTGIISQYINDQSTRSIDDGYSKRSVVHLGGFFSPAMLKDSDIYFLNMVLIMLKEIEHFFDLILPPYMLPKASMIPENVNCISCSPDEVPRILLDGFISLTTSGIEHTYESILLNKPTMFLPPFNMTQYLQLVHLNRIFPGSVRFDFSSQFESISSNNLDTSTFRIQSMGVDGIWEKQFNQLKAFLQKKFKSSDFKFLKVIHDIQSEMIRNIPRDGAQVITSKVLDLDF
ncbi:MULTISPECIES: hypothetical protein [Cyanophyceae]|uniref:hypothetical protein n=2 Tax=Cyanophyceae TaxID=3028117 RepID=UPI000A1CBB55|nr:hypothetical protein [Picosynechococcus sp. PCC 7002]